jgi:hypothetical protein
MERRGDLRVGTLSASPAEQGSDALIRTVLKHRDHVLKAAARVVAEGRRRRDGGLWIAVADFD